MSEVIDLVAKRRERAGVGVLVIDPATGRVTGRPPLADIEERAARIAGALIRIRRLFEQVRAGVEDPFANAEFEDYDY